MKPAKPASTTMDPQTFIPPTMRALFCTADDGIVFDMNYPVPQPSPTQYLILDQTAAIDGDLPTRKKARPAKTAKSAPVHSLCGTVIATPAQDLFKPDGPRFKIGDHVYGLVHDRLQRNDDGSSSPAAAADYVLASEDELALKPTNITAAEAACIPLPGLTAWQALFSEEYGGIITTSRALPALVPVAGGGPAAPSLRVLVSGAIESEIGAHCLCLLRSASMLSTAADSVWICATCSSSEQKDELLHGKEKPSSSSSSSSSSALPNEVVVVTPRSTRTGSDDFDLAATFRDHGWEPVDLVLDCARPTDGGGGGELYRQAHSPAVVRDKGVVLSVGGGGTPYTASLSGPETDDHEYAHGYVYAHHSDASGRGLRSQFIHVRPDGTALRHITRLVEDGSVRGRVRQVVDLWAGADVLESATGCGDGESDLKACPCPDRGMVVLRVN